MSDGLTVDFDIHFEKGYKSEKQIKVGEKSKASNSNKGRIPRISKLMALAIHLDKLLRNGELKSYADIAQLGLVSRARLTHIMNLLNLAPDIQEEILFLPVTKKGRDKIVERNIRHIANEVDWDKQREMWNKAIIYPADICP